MQMVPLLFFAFHLLPVFHLGQDLCGDYLDLRVCRSETMEAAKSFSEPPRMWKEINVTFSKDKGNIGKTKVSLEDYDRLIGIAETWHVSSRGYVISNKRKNGKYTATYMHKEILGDKGRHRNGDLLDNRRENLYKMQKNFKLHSRGLSPVNLTSDNSALPLFNGTARVTYEFQNKIYIGEMEVGFPHGYGQLIEPSEERLTLGMWRRGVIVDGVVIVYKQLPQMMSGFPAWRDIDRLLVISNGIVRRPHIPK